MLPWIGWGYSIRTPGNDKQASSVLTFGGPTRPKKPARRCFKPRPPLRARYAGFASGCARKAAFAVIVREVPARLILIGDGPARPHGGPWLFLAVFATGIYGGYFGAAQGVVLIALLGIFIDDGLQRLNALKNVLAALVNGIAAVLFILLADVDWAVAGLLAAGAICGGQLGARLGRRIPAGWLRAVIVVVGVVVAVRLLVE